MRHPDRWDLPKGHVDPGESEMVCALRELAEETSLTAGDIELVPDFRFAHQYQVREKRDGKLYDKTLVVFLARLVRDANIHCTEHGGFEWFRWSPPHRIQERTIDTLLAAVEAFCKRV